MEDRVAEFVRLADVAIKIATAIASTTPNTEKAWMVPRAVRAVEILEWMKEHAVQGRLPSSKESGLGLTKFLGEWAPPELFKAGGALEDLFLARF